MTSVKTFAWLTLLLPLAGMLINALGYRVLGRGRLPGYIGTLALAGSFAVARRDALRAASTCRTRSSRSVAVAWDYASVAVGGGQNLDAQLSLLVDPLSVFMALVVTRRLDAHPRLLGRLHGRATAATRGSSRT